MLDDLTHYDDPFAYVRIGRVDPSLVDALTDAARGDLAWERYDSFYRCWIARVPMALTRTLPETLTELTGVPLTPRTRLTLQRMAPGDGATAHTDRPLLGYESVRLVVQLTEGWQPGDGGRFAVHPDPQGAETTRWHEPTRGTAVAFAMRRDSHHSVEDCARERLTAVVHCEHIGNTEQLGHALRGLLTGARFTELPAAVHPLMDEAEATRDEQATLYAGTVALVLHRWGQPPEAVAEGYAAALAPWTADGPFAAARWLARLWLEDFDLAAWESAASFGRRDAHCPDLFRELAFPQVSMQFCRLRR
ncbi:MAG: 2OG-Fe(II) oxygenase [Deltaproteobacteria bacterium]|nr:MAG: 2OG-Fe(II) oxygenase [Deltaproteobacteria bacterium]